MPRPRDDDDFNDEAPRRRRSRDNDDDEPRGRRSRDDDFDDEPPRRTTPKKGMNVFGLISIIVGALGLVISLIPCIGIIIGLPIAIIGLILGIVGLFVGKESGRGLPITGSAVSFVAILISLGWFAYGYFSVKKAQKQMEADVQASRVEIDRANKATREIADKERKEREKENEKRELNRIRNEILSAAAVQATAQEIIDDYGRNKSDAERKYVNRTVEITMKVSDITERAEFSSKTVRFIPEDQKLKIACIFKGHIRDELKDVKVGDTIIVRGKLNGIIGPDAISVSDCTVMPKASDPPVKKKKGK